MNGAPINVGAERANTPAVLLDTGSAAMRQSDYIGLPIRLRGEKARNTKRKAVLDRIELLEEAIERAKEYLKSGKHAHWSGFRPWFVGKKKDGKELPPHRDWVKNVFLPRKEKALNRAEKILERLR